MAARRVLIVGGVAGGMSCAARCRRLNEEAEILVFERGPYPSFANCGLPYYVGREIKEREKLLLQTPDTLKSRLNLDVRVNQEVVAIDRGAKTVSVRRLDTGEKYTEAYDALVLAPGAQPVRPPLPGIDREGHFVVRGVPDVDAIDAWIEAKGAKTAVVAGAGYIGLEMAEQLHRRGLQVAVAEALPQAMAPLDPEIAAYIHLELIKRRIDLHLSDAVARFEAPAEGESARASVVVLRSGERLPADMVVLGMGVKPETTLAASAGLEIGANGGIRVDEFLRTNDPCIYAAGDAIETRHAVTGQWEAIPLAGPANRQGRLAADNIMGRAAPYRGSLGTGIVRVFGVTAGMTGASEKMLRAAGMKYEKMYVHHPDHATYYPGFAMVALKLIYDPETGRVLGAQSAGAHGVDKRLDILSTAIQAGMTVDDLADIETAYAPPFGAARDPITQAATAAQNAMRGDVEIVHWHDVEDWLERDDVVVVDFRPEAMRRSFGAVPGSINIPLSELRGRLGELPKDKTILATCQSGQTSYMACRLLQQRGYKCKNLSGAFLTWSVAENGRGD